jgi:excinuclease ABC subunit C
MAEPTSPSATPPTLRRSLGALPDQPGVYLFKDADGKILYVGKAASLKKRVSSYFCGPMLRADGAEPTHQGAADLGPRIAKLVELIRGLELRTTASEPEALLLEAQLIQQHRPKYNVAYRDDKSHPMLRLTNEPFPRLMLARRRRGKQEQAVPEADGERRFGPYADAGQLRQALQFLRRVFPLRTCKTFPKTPCLEYHLGQCLAPCVGYIDEAAYRRIVNDLVAFLEGRRDPLLRELSRRMQEASRDQRFEEAARLRDQIQALTSIIVAKARSAQAGPLEQLQLALKLPVYPRRIEGFDISNIYGSFAVGSMVTFVEGRPYKAHYRRFKIETVEGIDDYQMMREVIRRRYGGSLSTELPNPDVVLVDGGKGQLHAALEELQALGRAFPILGLAKQHEHLFVPGRRDPIVLLPTSPVLHLVQHLRDEAHRFAVTYHRRLRAKPIEASALDALPGVGQKRKAALLATFGSVDRIRRAAADAIASAAGISTARAETLLARLRAGRGVNGMDTKDTHAQEAL